MSAQAQETAPLRPRIVPEPAGRSAARTIKPLGFFPVEPLWTVALNTAVTAPPAYDAHAIYIPIEENRLVAYDLMSATRRWIAPVGTTLAPAAGDDLVFLFEPNAIIAVRADDGSLAWQMPFADRSALPLVWNNGWLFATTIDGTVLAYRATDGQLLWRHDVGSPAHARLAVSGNRLYVPCGDGRVVALKLETGERVWERRLGGAASEILALEDRLFVGSKDNYFYCLRADTGEDSWRWRTGADVIGTAAVDESTVYFVALDNVLRALHRSNGVQRWQKPMPIRPTTGPLKIEDTLLVMGLAPTLRGYAAQTGTAAGDITAAGELAAPAHVFDDPLQRHVLLVLTRDIAKGALLTAMTTSFEPKLLPQLTPLPNAIEVPPKLPRSASQTP